LNTPDSLWTFYVNGDSTTLHGASDPSQGIVGYTPGDTVTIRIKGWAYSDDGLVSEFCPRTYEQVYLPGEEIPTQITAQMWITCLTGGSCGHCRVQIDLWSNTYQSGGAQWPSNDWPHQPDYYTCQ